LAKRQQLTRDGEEVISDGKSFHMHQR